MVIHTLKLNVITLILTATFPAVTLAATVSGAGNTQTISGASPVEDWDVSDNATLVITDGGATGNIALHDSSTLNAGNTGISTGGIVANESNLALNGVQVTDASDAGIKLALSAGGSVNGSTLTATDSVISGLGSGLSLIGGSSAATLINTQVTAMGVGSTTNQIDRGNGVSVYNGTLDILSGSVVTGVQNGISVEVDDRYSSSADITINNSSVTGQNGSAIRVGNDGFSAPLPVNITVTNGATLSGGNGDILTVTGGSLASLSVSGTSLTGNITSDSTSTTDVALTGSATLTGVLNNVSDLTLDDTSAVTLTGNSSVSTLNNSGTVAFSSGSAGRTLAINGNYTGNDGLLIFNSVLAGDNSATDRLQVNGDTSGTTRVSVTNQGGNGDATINGIELIGVTGNSAGSFTQTGPIVAGAYDYRLVRGTGSNTGNWYLTSDITDPGSNGSDPVDSVKVYRPEGGAYAANLAAANTLFTTTLADRQGETAYTDALTGERKLTSLWMKNSGAHTHSRDASGQLKTQANSYALMLGGDIAMGEAENGSRWRLGALGGYGNSRSSTTSSLAGRQARGEVDGYTTGLYGTWYAEGSDRKGLYVDTVAQYSWFSNRVNSQGVGSEKYDADGLQASVEAGYVLPLGGAVYLQPNAQLGWSGVKADTHTESNGTVVSGTGSDNIRTRLGVRVFTEGHSHLDEGKGRSFRPYAEVNWIHNTEEYGVSMDGAEVTSAGTRNIGEAKLGVLGQLTPALNVTGTVGQQVGDAGYSSTEVTAGLRYSF